MNILSILISEIFVLASKPIYSSDLFIAIFLSAFFSFSGSGTTPVIGETSCGEVPQVTNGSISLPSIFISLSNLQPSSEYKDFIKLTALFQVSPFGDIFFPFKYSKVFSSGAIKPALAPASIVILQTVILSSMLKPFITSPANSMT